MNACRGKDVLDLGCLEHSWKMSISRRDWLHARIRAVSASCLGVDFLAEDVEEMNRRGYRMVYGDVLKDSPPGQFDVVVAADLIEHLENPGMLLEYIADALRPDGIAIITTPNPTCLDQVLRILFRGAPAISPEHAVMFDPFTFDKLVLRSRLRVRQFQWLEPRWFVLSDSRFLSHYGAGKGNASCAPVGRLASPLSE